MSQGKFDKVKLQQMQEKEKENWQERTNCEIFS